MVVYEKTHLLHETYFKERGICHTNNWHVIDKSDVENMEYIIFNPSNYPKFSSKSVTVDANQINQNQTN